MAKKVSKVVKLQVPGGKATPAPPVGPALGQAGVNIMAFVKDFNARTAKQVGLVIPVVITVYEPFLHFHLQDAPCGRTAEESRRPGKGIRRTEQEQGRYDQPRQST